MIQTPLIDFAPKAAATIVKCQDVLAEYLNPGSGMTQNTCIETLLSILDDREIVSAINAIKESVSEKVSMGITDRLGKDIFDGDPLRLCVPNDRYPLIIEGVAKFMDDEWQIFKDKGNHVGILHNQPYISKI